MLLIVIYKVFYGLNFDLLQITYLCNQSRLIMQPIRNNYAVERYFAADHGLIVHLIDIMQPSKIWLVKQTYNFLLARSGGWTPLSVSTLCTLPLHRSTNSLNNTFIFHILILLVFHLIDCQHLKSGSPCTISSSLPALPLHLFANPTPPANKWQFMF